MSEYSERRNMLRLGLIATGALLGACAPRIVRDYVFEQKTDAPNDGEQWTGVEILGKEELQEFYKRQFLLDSRIDLKDQQHKSVIKSTFYHYLIQLGVEDNEAENRANNIETLPTSKDNGLELCSMCVNNDKDGLGLRISQNHINKINEIFSFGNNSVSGRWAKLALDIAHEAIHGSVNGYRNSDDSEDFGALGSISERKAVQGLYDGDHTSTGIIESLLKMKVNQGDSIEVQQTSISEEFMAEWAGYDTFSKFFKNVIPSTVINDMVYYGNYNEFYGALGSLNDPENSWKDFFFDKGGDWKDLSEYHKNGELHNYYSEVGSNFLNKIVKDGGTVPNLTNGNIAALGLLAFVSFSLFTGEKEKDEKLPVFYFYNNPINDEALKAQGHVLLQRMKEIGINVES